MHFHKTHTPVGFAGPRPRIVITTEALSSGDECPPPGVTPCPVSDTVTRAAWFGLHMCYKRAVPCALPATCWEWTWKLIPDPQWHATWDHHPPPVDPPGHRTVLSWAAGTVLVHTSRYTLAEWVYPVVCQKGSLGLSTGSDEESILVAVPGWLVG